MTLPETVFLLLLFVACLGYLGWGFKNLPEESRQMLAAIPVHKREDGTWTGLNITWYGLLTANAVSASAALFILLNGSLGWNTLNGFLLVAWIMTLALPAARIIARVIERKANTFTTGGAFAVGLAAVWPGVILINRISGPAGEAALDPLTAMAVLMIAYTFGEGIGRMACISFGCCYGKRLEDSPPWLQQLLGRFHFVFQGETKKIAYAQGWQGVPVVPIQGMTALILVTTGMVSLALLFAGHTRAAFLTALVLSQGWRVLSEFLRSDHRGSGRLTAYQVLGLASIAYGAVLSLLLQTPAGRSLDLFRGFHVFSQSSCLLFLDGLWMLTLYYMGRSRVTASSIRFQVLKDRI